MFTCSVKTIRSGPDENVDTDSLFFVLQKCRAVKDKAHTGYHLSREHLLDTLTYQGTLVRRVLSDSLTVRYRMFPTVLGRWFRSFAGVCIASAKA